MSDWSVRRTTSQGGREDRTAPPRRRDDMGDVVRRRSTLTHLVAQGDDQGHAHAHMPQMTDQVARPPQTQNDPHKERGYTRGTGQQGRPDIWHFATGLGGADHKGALKCEGQYGRVAQPDEGRGATDDNEHLTLCDGHATGTGTKVQSTATISDINKGPAKGHGRRSRAHPASSTVRSSCRRYEQGDQLVANNFKAIQALHAA